MSKVLFSFLGIIAVSLILVAPALANTSEVKILPTDEVVNEDYFSFGNRSEINGTVNGDVYAAAGEVLVTGIVNGDFLAAGANLVISGEITGDVRVGGGNVTFSGAQIGGNVTVGGGNVTFDASTNVTGSVVAASGNLQVFAPVGKGANLGGGSILLANSIGGNVSAGANSISLTNGADIDGNLTYYSENEANISEGATISGSVKREAPKQGKENMMTGEEMEQVKKDAGIALAGFVYAIKIIDVFWLIIVGLLFIYLLPVFTKRTADYAFHKLGWAFLAGLGVLIILPIIGIIFMITLIGIPIAFILFFAFFLVFWLGRIFTIYALGLFILGKLNKKDARGLAYITGIIIYIILSIIPFIDFIAGITISIAGVGALVITKGQVFKELRNKKLL